MSEIYSGLASFGKVQSVIGLVIVGFIFLALMGVGIYLITSNSKFQKTTAKINFVICTMLNSRYNCETIVEYTIDTKTYNTSLTLNNLLVPFNKDDTIEIEYNTESPGNIREISSSNKYLGWILVGIAVVILIFSTISTILVFKYKPYAAYTGVQSLIPRVSVPYGGRTSLINVGL